MNATWEVGANMILKFEQCYLRSWGTHDIEIWACQVRIYNFLFNVKDRKKVPLHPNANWSQVEWSSHALLHSVMLRLYPKYYFLNTKSTFGQTNEKLNND